MISLICEELGASSACVILPSLDHIVDLLLVTLDVMQNLTASYSLNQFTIFL